VAIKISFDDSFGGREELKDSNWLKDKVFNEGNDFWEGASGQTALSYRDSNISSSMFLIGRETHGFMVDHRYSKVNERTYSLKFDEHTGETIEAYTGGNPDLYFKEYFVPKEIAWQAIEYFLETGERDPSLTWEIAELVETA
jgi:hypothetical protein